MTRPSRGISEIQEKARGKNKMATTKAGMYPLKKKDTLKAKVVKREAPTPDLAQLGAMRSAAPVAPMAAPMRGMAPGMKCGGYAKGGSPLGPSTMSEDVEKGSNKLTKFGESAVQKRGKTKGKNFGDSGATRAYAAGGRIDGCATKGKTKGRII